MNNQVQRETGYPFLSGLGALILTSLLLAGCSGTEPPRRLFFTVATGGTGGIYYPLGATLARIIMEQLPGVNASAQATAGSLINCGLIQQGKADVAFTMADVAREAFRDGTKVIPEPYDRLRAIASLYPNFLQIVTYPGSPISNIEDLRGKRVAVGAPGSGTEFNAQRVLAAHGITYSEFRPDYLSFTEIVAGLKNGSIDAGFINASYPVSAIVDLDTSIGVQFVDVDKSQALEIQNEDSNYFPAVVPAGTYKSLTTDLNTIGIMNLLVVREDLPEELVYRVTQLLFEQRQELIMAHAVARSLDLSTAIQTEIPLHRGAERYYREEGVKIP